MDRPRSESRSRVSASSWTSDGSAGPASSPRLRRAVRAFSGRTTTKWTTAATITKVISAVITLTTSMSVFCLPCTSSMPKPGLAGGVTALINGSTTPAVNAVPIAVNAAPTTTATARSTTFPRRTKSLKPLNTVSPRRPSTISAE